MRSQVGLVAHGPSVWSVQAYGRVLLWSGRMETAYGLDVWSVQAYGLVLLWSGRMEKAYGPSVWSVQAYGPCRRMVRAGVWSGAVWSGRMVLAYGPCRRMVWGVWSGRMVQAFELGVWSVQAYGLWAYGPCHIVCSWRIVRGALPAPSLS